MNHLDKINIFYSKGKYNLTLGPHLDLSTLYGASCGLSGDYQYTKWNILQNLAGTLCKIIEKQKTGNNEQRMSRVFHDLFFEPYLATTTKVEVDIDRAIVVILRILSSEQVFDRNNGELIDIYGIGKVTDNPELTQFIKDAK